MSSPIFPVPEGYVFVSNFLKEVIICHKCGVDRHVIIKYYNEVPPKITPVIRYAECNNCFLGEE